MDYLSLKPDRNLLNAKFETYHLGPATLEVKSKNLLQPVAFDPLREDHYSFSHLRAHAEQNLLVFDLWSDEETILYFVDYTFAVMGVPFNKDDATFGSPVTMCKFPSPSTEKIKEHISPSISFPSSEFCLISDGAGKLYAIETGCRTKDLEKHSWEAKEITLIKDFGFPFYLRQCCQNDSENIYCLLMSLEDEKKSSSSHPRIYLHLLHLIHSSKGSNSAGEQFIVNEAKMLSGTTIPAYVSYSPDFKSIIIGSQKAFAFSTKDNSEAEEKEEENGSTEISENKEEKSAESESVLKSTAYTNEQMEECDLENEEDLRLTVMDKSDGSIKLETQVAGHQWLFNQTFKPLEPASFCVRHDVDGLLWKPVKSDTNSKVVWKHDTTFNALGYVQASKKNHKYTICGSNFGFVAIVDCNTNVYIYVTDNIAANDGAQYVLELPAADEILGVQASRKTLFLLTKKALFAVNVI